MKLAEALQERSDLSQRIAQLRSRLTVNATVQEGEKTAEDPVALLDELNRCIDQQEQLIAQINLVNSRTMVEGRTLTELLSRRDSLNLRIEAYHGLINDASRLAQRAVRTEIKILSAVDVPALQKEVDRLSKELRKVDNTIQETNWSTTL
ncbi:MAG: DIP1984 family protein [Bacteroidales bacterium]|nr:DIP1984 family protein [Bacteroidales bacterium]